MQQPNTIVDTTNVNTLVLPKIPNCTIVPLVAIKPKVYSPVEDLKYLTKAIEEDITYLGTIPHQGLIMNKLGLISNSLKSIIKNIEI